MKAFFIISVLIFSGFSAPVFAQSETLEGFWEGAIEREGKLWRVSFDIKQTGGDYKALADFLDVDGLEREFSVKPTSEGFRLERPQPSGIPIIFEGKVEGGRFKGNWSGFGVNAVFDLKRSAAAKPEYYREKEVTFKNGEVSLSGALITPLKGKSFPAVVITHGGTPNERGAYKSWALHFVKKGLAALIYDKRGAGRSGGETRSASMDDLANDALAGVNLLRTLPEIDRSKIGVIGHSQGGWIAPLAAATSKDVAFVIASAASGVSPDRQSIYHRANVMRAAGFSEEAVKIASDLRQRLYATGRMLLENNPNAEAERKKISAELEKYAKEPWLEAAALPPNLGNDKPTRGGLELLFFKPEPMWEKVKVPVLLVWGERDMVVPVNDGRKIIETALKKAGNRDVTVKIFPGVDHGVVLVRQDKTWDFPRVDLNYYAAMVEWLAARINKKG
jgi:pimeloyl-ACP methyl ester carboxylesterase